MVLAAATMLARAKAAGRVVAAEGVLTLNRFEASVENPAVKVERDSWASFRQFAEQLGIGPASRARLAGLVGEQREAVEEMDELAEMRDRKASAG